MKTVLQSEKKCYVCGTTYNLHSHHIFQGINRKVSERNGMKVWLCMMHHTGSNEAVHNNKELDLHLKRMAQSYYEKQIGTREEFMSEFGRNYLD